MTLTIEILTPHAVQAVVPDLVALLEDAVQSGASVGFLLPVTSAELEAYWHGVLASLRTSEKVLLVARQEDRLVGCVQLALEPRANGAHRAEVQKLLVLRAARRQGIGAALMAAAEDTARAARRTLLVLDTRAGDDAARLYRRLGYQLAGVIPHYARSTNGQLDGSAFMYKELAER
jgi:ribosomal protein S18 acetylase RimI-like enzyme